LHTQIVECEREKERERREEIFLRREGNFGRTFRALDLRCGSVSGSREELLHQLPLPTLVVAMPICLFRCRLLLLLLLGESKNQ
jgi:hypothetical protein